MVFLGIQRSFNIFSEGFQGSSASLDKTQFKLESCQLSSVEAQQIKVERAASGFQNPKSYNAREDKDIGKAFLNKNIQNALYLPFSGMVILVSKSLCVGPGLGTKNNWELILELEGK